MIADISNLNEVKLTGGARIGSANATWPFAKLVVTRDKLQLNATIIGNLVFKPSDIISIEPYSYLFTGGIKINHRVENYKSLVVFTTSTNSNELINQIKQSGFLDNNDKTPFYIDEEIKAAQLSGGFPLKTSAAIIIVVIWNLLCLPFVLNFFKGGKPSFMDIRYPAEFMMVLCILLLVAEPVQKMILKPGRKVSDIKPFLYFTILILGFMLAVNFLIPAS
jgi:hypothetical protein